MTANLKTILKLMQDNGAKRFFFKRLASNDNSKNQIYLGGDFSSLNIIPHGKVYIDEEDKTKGIRHHAKADINFFWTDDKGIHRAPFANLILYPKYPEVRLSGLLKGCRSSPSTIVASRQEGRILILGIAGQSKHVFGHIVAYDNSIANEINDLSNTSNVGIFEEISSDDSKTSRENLLERLLEIHDQGWIFSQKLNNKGEAEVYVARNGGGYTLESQLGIMPNSYSKPDFLGWEIKQYAVKNFSRFTPKNPITLMTPEPTSGIYGVHGAEHFLRIFGYSDKSGKQDRINFGGIYKNLSELNKNTHLTLNIFGYDHEKHEITDMEGSIALVSSSGEIAAQWSFPDLMEHWNRKHALAAYVPSLFKNTPPRYKYGNKIVICEGTDFNLFMRGVCNGTIYYDPAIKMENSTSQKPEVKKRSQFRIKHKDLSSIYHQTTIIDLKKDI